MRLPGFLSRHTEFIGHVATMMSGRTVAAAIALFTTPIVARLFVPSDFGVAAAFTASVSIVSMIAALRYEAALSLPKQDQEALVLLALAHWILFVVCLAMLVAVVIYASTEIRIPVMDLLGNWAWLLPLAVLLSGALKVHENWLIRKKAFSVSSVSLVVGNATTSGTRIGFGAVGGTSVYGLILGDLLGTACRLVVQKSAAKEGLRATFVGIDWKAMRQVASAYSDFPRLNAPAGFVFTLGGNLPVLLFGVMFSPAVAGMYAMANRLAQVPITIVASSMRRVFLQKAASIHNRGGSLRKAFLLSTGGLAVLGAIPLACLSMFGEPILRWLLGDRWIEAGRYLEIIAPWMFMIWVTATSNPVFVTLRKQKLWLSLQTSLTILRLGAFGVAYALAASPEWTLHAFVIVTVLGNLFTIGIALSLILRQQAAEDALI
jgi:O-antigen/teichoic acid export membrane protein